MAVCGLRYNLSVTGDCTNTGLGAFTVGLRGTAPPFYYQFLAPFDDPIPIALGAGVTAFTRTNLTPDTYTFLIFDSCSPPTQQIVTAIISDGVCVSLLNHTNTTCSLLNGAVTARTDNNLQLTQYYLYENTSGYVTSGASNQDDFVFNGLGPGTYYVTVNDGGGCSGKSESCIIKPSTPIDYGFYVVNDSPCTSSTGKVFITGITGYSPYTYSWSTGSIESSISGLTSGPYSVTVSDSTGCVVSKNVQVGTVPAVGFAEVITVTPSCFGTDGQITVVVTGGTPPYYYQASNGQSQITFNETYTLTGLGSNNYSITVTDSALCTATVLQTLTPPNGFTILTVGTVNSTCNNSSGALSPINLLGGSPPFVYTLTYPSGNSIQQTVNGFSNQFQGLSAGTYTLTIANGPCTFTNTYTINNTEKYTLTTATTGTTCQGSNGRISVRVSSGATLPLTYQLTGQPTISNTSQTAVTFNNLFAGNYQLTVTDALSCSQIQTIAINAIDSIDYSLNGTNLTGPDNGTIQLYITEGPPPYNISWTSNVNGQTGLSLTNLSAGTYGVTVTDSNGCQLTRELTLLGYNNFGTYDVYTYCETLFQNNGLTILKKPQNMFLEGFYDLTSGETNCVLNEAIFYAEVNVGDIGTETQFFVSNSLSSYPDDNLWYDVIRDTLLSFPVIGSVDIDPTENRITIQTNCTQEALSLNSAEVSVELKISYDVSCVCKLDPVPGPDFNGCDMIFLDLTQQIYHYVYSSNTSTLLTVDGYNYDSPSVAFTNDKMWTYTTSPGSTIIREWNITLNPFTAIFNRTITLNFAIGNAIGIKSSNVLITTNSEVTPNRYIEINITGPTPTVVNKTNLVENEDVIGSIVNDNNGALYVLIQNTSNAPFLEYYLKLVSSVDYTTYYIIDLTSSIAGAPSGLFTDPLSISPYYLNLVDTNGSIYQITLQDPFTVNLIGSVSGAGVLTSLYQVNSCFQPNFNQPYLNCQNGVNVTATIGDNIGHFVTRVNLNEGIGPVTLEVIDGNNLRVQIIWNGNIVADSLFLLTDTESAQTQLINKINETTFLYSYIYTPGTGNSVNIYGVSGENNWTTNGTIDVNFSSSDLASIYDLRLLGSVGGQIGVVPSFPSPAVSSCNPNILLRFTKTLASPSYCDIVVYQISPDAPFGGGFRFNIINCPGT